MSEILDVVNELDEVIGQAERDEVHRTGLVCRLVYVCFCTPKGEIILQKRSLAKKNDAGKLTTTASGHVASGQDYLEAATRETFEESGIKIKPENLISLGIVRVDYTQGSYVSNAMRGLYLYKFNGNISDLIVEDGEGAGFVVFSIEEFEKQLRAEPDNFAEVLTGVIGDKLLEVLKV